MSEDPPVWWHGLVAGPLSGVASRIVVYPADTLKARQQIMGAVSAANASSAGRAQGMLGTARALVAAEGLAGLYRGLGAVLIGVVPANAAYFGGYEAGRRLVPASWGTGGDMAVGAIAQLVAGVAYTPLDIVKERLQVQSLMAGAYRYDSAWQAFAGLARDSPAAGSAPAAAAGGAPGSRQAQQQPQPQQPSHRQPKQQQQQQQQQLGSSKSSRLPPLARSLFRGYWATNAVWLPWNVMYVAGYLQAKRGACAALGVGRPEDLPSWAVASCSAGAAAAAAVATHPADVVKTRLQVLSAAAGGGALSGVGIARHMWAAEGGAAFWRGLGARVLNIAPGCALSWALYEGLLSYMAGRHK